MSLERVLVTGGTGVIGAWVVRGLVERGIEPIVFVRGRTNEIGRTINGDIDGRLTWALGDLLDPDALAAAVERHRPQAIIHMASAKPWQMEPPWAAEPDGRLAIEQIALATWNVLEVARKAGVKRVVYASSKAVYDDVVGAHAAPDYLPLPEEYPKLPRMLYGIGKLAAEHLGLYYARNYGIEFLGIRFSSAFGPLKRGPTATSPDGMFYAALAGEEVKIRRLGPGERDDFAYNKDIADGFVLAALAGSPRHHAYNLGSGMGIDHEDLARAISAVVPGARVSFSDAAAGGAGAAITDRARCVMDIRRATADFGYVPRFVPLEAAFTDFLAEERRMGRQPAATTA